MSKAKTKSRAKVKTKAAVSTAEPKSVSVEGIGELNKEASPFEIIGYEKHAGCSIRDGDVAGIGETFLAIQERDGHVTVEATLAAAKDPKNPMHSYITWDDKEAANKCRIKQAKYLMSNIKARCIYPKFTKQKITEKKEFSVRFLHPVANAGDRTKVYKTLDKVIVNEDHKRSVSYDMYRYLMSAFNRFNGFAEVLEDLEQLEPILLSLAKRLEISPKEVRTQIRSVRGL